MFLYPGLFIFHFLCFMKKIVFILFLAALACDPVDYHLTTGVSRTEAFAGHGKYAGNQPGSTSESVLYDTLAFMTGIEFPETYNWVRDTAYGNVEAAIVLFRDGKRILSVSTGSGAKISAEPDMHHLVEGHVYSEYASRSRTWIKKDGEELCSYDRAEKLRGLIVKGRDVYTLGQARDGHGFSLRKNGEVLVEKDEGKIIGMLDSDSFYRSGALYEDDGCICFSYRKPGSSLCCLVADGKETLVNTDGEILDLRRINGEIWVLEQGPDGAVKIRSSDRSNELRASYLPCTKVCRLSVYKGEVVAIGDYGNAYSGYGSCVWNNEGEVLMNNSGKTDYYLSGDYSARVQSFSGSMISFVTSDGRLKSESGRQLFFPYRGACLLGSRFILCTTKIDMGKKTVVYDGGQNKEVEIRGFLCSAELVEVRR